MVKRPERRRLLNMTGSVTLWLDSCPDAVVTLGWESPQLYRATLTALTGYFSMSGTDRFCQKHF